MADRGYPLLAAQYIRRQAKQLAEQFDGVLAAEDAEYIHRARVTTRRLRAALRMFAQSFPAKQVRRWRKALRQTTARLGEARDRDVQIEFLCGLLSPLEAKQCFPGIARVLVQLERDREKLHSRVVRAVNRLKRKRMLPAMRRTMRDVLSNAVAEAQILQTPATRAEIAKHISRQIDELLRHQESLGDPGDRQAHHAMRIAAKRLRYTLEIARPLYEGKLEPSLAAIKRVQALLGEVHDCDVWEEQLTRCADEERKRIVKHFGHPGRAARLQPGIDYLRHDRERRRKACFEELLDYWADLRRQDLWQALRNLLQSAAAALTNMAAADESEKAGLDREPAMADAGGVAETAAPAPVPVGICEPALPQGLTGTLEQPARNEAPARAGPAPKPLLTAGS